MIDTEVNKEIIKEDKNKEIKDLEEKYPKVIAEFCTVCSFPVEYCEISHAVLLKRKELIKFNSNTNPEESKTNDNTNKDNTEKKENSDDKTEKIEIEGTENKDDTKVDENKETKEKQNKKGKKEYKVVIEETKRGKKKHITYVQGLEKFGINLKDTSKLLSKKFACSATVTKEADNSDSITLTGEFLYEMQEFLLEKFGNILKESDFKLITPKK